jgi:hypothetical protein
MPTLTSQPVQLLPTLVTQSFRLDAPLHKLLQKLPEPSPTLARRSTSPELHLLCPRQSFRNTSLLCTKT